MIDRKRNEALQFARLLMPLQRIDELDVDLRMRQSSLGQRGDQLLLQKRHIDWPRGDDSDPRAGLGLMHLVLLDPAVLAKRRAEHQRMDVDPSRVDEDVV